MGTLHPQELLKQWELEKIPLEMATGHSLQNLVKMQQAIDTYQPYALQHPRRR